jgi:hypothetical protein
VAIQEDGIPNDQDCIPAPGEKAVRLLLEDNANLRRVNEELRAANADLRSKLMAATGRITALTRRTDVQPATPTRT